MTPHGSAPCRATPPASSPSASAATATASARSATSSSSPTRNGAAERAGISSSLWSLFGQVWPAGRVLAEAMCTFDIAGKRILELGCGLGLSSLVLQRRRADIVASDHHPLAQSFLAHNAALNDLPELAYHDLPWGVPDAKLGRFDLIIGSDILYERDHAAQLAAMMLRHAQPDAEVLITDPGRGNSSPVHARARRAGL